MYGLEAETTHLRTQIRKKSRKTLKNQCYFPAFSFPELHNFSSKKKSNKDFIYLLLIGPAYTIPPVYKTKNIAH